MPSAPEQTGPVGEGAAEVATARAEAATAGEAKWTAMKELEHAHPGLRVEDVEFESEDTGEGVRVTATADLGAWRAAERLFRWPDEPTERVREILRRVAAFLDLRASVDVRESEQGVAAALEGSELGLFIGKHGQTIDAVEAICGQAAYRGHEERRRVTVDAGGYRERREASLHRQADRGVTDALRFERPVELDAMSAPERKIVHVYLQERPDVETHSEGDEPFRRIVISPVR